MPYYSERRPARRRATDTPTAVTPGTKPKAGKKKISLGSRIAKALRGGAPARKAR
ncbi:MAG TPA: hypothetical protein VGN52_08510 [Burkholderiales bacterium]|jgi:hypothetical protein